MCVYVVALTSRFSGFTSRCTMFMACRYFRAPARLYTMPLASRSVYLADDVMASNRSPPCRRGEGLDVYFIHPKGEFNKDNNNNRRSG